MASAVSHIGAAARSHLQSKNQKPLERYFPEVAQGLEEIAEGDFVLDGGLVIAVAPSRACSCACIRPKAASVSSLCDTPGELIVLICWRARASRCSIGPSPSGGSELEDFIAQAGTSVLRLGEATDREPVARDWLGREGLDGIVAKRPDLPYRSGERAMRKFKLWKSVDCVIAGSTESVARRP